jgi:hypothetical protein
LAGVNSPWDQGAYILMADGMEATWTGDRFVQRIG